MSTGPIRLSQGAHTALRPATAARITGGFWATRRRVNAEVSVPQGPDRLERAGNLANLRAAAGAAPAQSGFRGDFPFQDSDVHKWLEAASWQLADGGEGPAEELVRQVERLAGLVTAAQAEDGYLQTHYQLGPDARRWAEPHWGHELYCAGHLLQAAVAHHRATGADGLLDVAVRCADLVDATFGPGRNETVCGHPEIETALVELYRETGERRYLDLAGYFVDRRGQGSLGDGPADGSPGPRPGAAYWQDHIPVREATAVAGHAVRQLYLLAGAADVAAETGDAGLRDALVRLWEDMTTTKTHLTGGVGSRHELESFGDAYELPPDRAYAETCAAIAAIHFGWRMALLTGEARYSDLVERTLFNGFASGVSIDGERWLYVNPLQVRQDDDSRKDATSGRSAHRTPWFRCACCPPNAMRLLASLPHYMASGDAQGLQLHQYASGSYEAGGGAVRVGTGYPWEGRIAVVVDTAPRDTDWTLSLRIPHWATAYEATVGGEPVAERADNGWLRLRRRWRPGETVVLSLSLTPRLTRPDPRADGVRGCAAIERGPLVYCLEQPDQPAGLRLDDIALDTDATLSAEHRPGLLGGVTVITSLALRHAVARDGWWPYRDGGAGSAGGARPDLDTGGAEALDPVPVTAIPYYAWANREPGAMRVWTPLQPPAG